MAHGAFLKRETVQSVHCGMKTAFFLRRNSAGNSFLLTVLGLQLGAGLGRHEAGHEAVVVLGADAARRRHRGADGHGGGDVGPRDDRAAGGRGGGGRGGQRGGGGLPCGGQVLLLRVDVDGVQTDLSGAARLPLVLHGCR